MFMISVMILLSFLIPSIMMALVTMTMEKPFKTREKSTPFECGFSPFKKARNSFSLRFFLITLIFLIFDMEIALILPMGLLMKVNNNLVFMLISFSVILILLLGLMHEWKNGALYWMK